MESADRRPVPPQEQTGLILRPSDRLGHSPSFAARFSDCVAALCPFMTELRILFALVLASVLPFPRTEGTRLGSRFQVEATEPSGRGLAAQLNKSVSKKQKFKRLNYGRARRIELS